MLKALLWESKPSSLLNRLAYILAAHPNRKVRNGKEAADLSRRAGGLDGYRTDLYRHTLAATEAEAGDFEAATRLSEEAIGDDVGHRLPGSEIDWDFPIGT